MLIETDKSRCWRGFKIAMIAAAGLCPTFRVIAFRSQDLTVERTYQGPGLVRIKVFVCLRVTCAKNEVG
jgi:hypothetical protein